MLHDTLVGYRVELVRLLHLREFPVQRSEIQNRVVALALIELLNHFFFIQITKLDFLNIAVQVQKLYSVFQELDFVELNIFLVALLNNRGNYWCLQLFQIDEV